MTTKNQQQSPRAHLHHEQATLPADGNTAAAADWPRETKGRLASSRIFVRARAIFTTTLVSAIFAGCSVQAPSEMAYDDYPDVSDATVSRGVLQTVVEVNDDGSYNAQTVVMPAAEYDAIVRAKEAATIAFAEGRSIEADADGSETDVPNYVVSHPSGEGLKTKYSAINATSGCKPSDLWLRTGYYQDGGLICLRRNGSSAGGDVSWLPSFLYPGGAGDAGSSTQLVVGSPRRVLRQQ